MLVQQIFPPTTYFCWPNKSSYLFFSYPRASLSLTLAHMSYPHSSVSVAGPLLLVRRGQIRPPPRPSWRGGLSPGRELLRAEYLDVLRFTGTAMDPWWWIRPPPMRAASPPQDWWAARCGHGSSTSLPTGGLLPASGPRGHLPRTALVGDALVPPQCCRWPSSSMASPRSWPSSSMATRRKRMIGKVSK